MADILLTHGYFLSEDEKEREIMKPYPPLGLLYLSAYLKRAGFSVEVFDATFATRGELYDRLSAGPAGVLGVYTNLLTRRSVLDLIREAQQHGWRVVLGGPEAANYPGQYLLHGADAVVVGEGEQTLAELLPRLTRGGGHDLSGVAGVVYLDGQGQVVQNAARALLADLDAEPWPDRGCIDLRRYVSVWREHHGAGSLNLITGRGCPYQCRWCSHAVFGTTHRRRSYFDCADELEFLHRTYGLDQVWYADDVFTIHHRWLFQYAAELRRRKLKVPFETISRADRLATDEVLATLADMGCQRIWIGSESGSQRILDAMRRDVTVEQVLWAVKAAQRHGIQVGMFLMWGYEGEGIEDIAATVEHVKRCDPDVFFTTVAYPIKNTAYFEAVADRVHLDKAWSEATDRDYRVRGQRSGAYYKNADRWLRGEVAACRVAGTDAMAADQHRREAQLARQAMLAELAETEA
ncbi:MAG: radical SAM protein [Planctomycetota bacterium]|nr:radical SAM protein [Planctomycetota bacterium]